VGWVVGWKKSTNSETTPHFPRTSSWIVSRVADYSSGAIGHPMMH
jgi:hypothetical protein